MTDERILKKIGKLLSLYGVSEEEKSNFLNDLEDKKYDEPEDEEGKVEENSGELEQEEKVEETETVEEKDGGKEIESEESAEVKEEGGEEPQLEESQEQEGLESLEEEPGSEEEVANDSEEVAPVEEPIEPEEPEFDAKGSNEELKKSIDGLASRIQTIEELVAKLGVPVEEEKPIGVSPAGNPVDENQDTTFDEINRKRIGY